MLIVVFVAAGNWQRGRLAQKVALAEQYEAASSTQPSALPRGDVDWNAWRFRNVEVRGRFDAGRQFLADNRVQAGRVGYHVIAPFTLDDGRVVLVNRGFAPRGRTREDVPSLPPPQGELRIAARINAPPPQYLELGEAAPHRAIVQNWSPERFAAATGVDVMPVVLEQTTDAGDGLVRDWALPDVGGDKHRVYMMQWYAFAALAFGLWAFFTFRALRARWQA